MATPAAQVSVESLFFLLEKENMHCENIEQYANLLASHGDAVQVSHRNQLLSSAAHP